MAFGATVAYRELENQSEQVWFCVQPTRAWAECHCILLPTGSRLRPLHHQLSHPSWDLPGNVGAPLISLHPGCIDNRNFKVQVRRVISRALIQRWLNHLEVSLEAPSILATPALCPLGLNEQHLSTQLLPDPSEVRAVLTSPGGCSPGPLYRVTFLELCRLYLETLETEEELGQGSRCP